MPVFNIADYLGIPAETPQQPMFQQTRNIVANPWARDFEIGQQADALKARRPFARLQAIQSGYDAIHQQADDLRRKQEAEAQAEQAVSALTTLTPGTPEYLGQRAKIGQQFPMAVLDPRVNRLMDDSDKLHNQELARLGQKNDAEIKSQENLNSLRRIGASEEQIGLVRGSPENQARLEYHLKQKPEKDMRGASLEKHYNMMNELVGQMAKAGTDLIPDPSDKTKTIPNPIYQEHVNELSRIGKALGDYYRSQYDPIKPIVTTAPQAAEAEEAPKSEAPIQPPIEQTVDLSKVPYHSISSGELNKQVAEIAAQEKQKREIAQKWYDAQIGLQRQLEKELPGNIELNGKPTNYSKLRRFAEAVLNQESIPDEVDPNLAANPEYRDVIEKNSSNGSRIKTVGADMLQKLGLLGKKAFSEPYNERVGSQDVDYNELLKVWAKNYLEQSPTTTHPTVQPISQETQAVKAKLLNSVGIGTNG